MLLHPNLSKFPNPYALVVVVALTGGTGYGQDNPDPVSLLQGVEALRLQVPPSTLKIHYVNKDSFLTNEKDYTVDFDGDKRRFITDPKSGHDERAVFNGSEVITYRADNEQAEICNITGGNLMCLFDPRLIGLSPYFQWPERVDVLIPYRTATKIEMVGRELVGSNQAWHVRVLMPPPAYSSDFWIDAEFRVHRHDMISVETWSFYDNREYPWLPTRVESKEYDAKHMLTSERVCKILEARTNIKLPESTWTISGLNMPTGLPNMPLGIPVIDLRLHQRVGYWTGKGLNHEVIFKSSTPATPAKRNFVAFIIVILVLIGPAALLYFLRRSKQN